MADFWTNSGYSLLNLNGDGYLELSDDYLRAYLLRPELQLIEESCGGEQELHGKLVEAPRSAVSTQDLAKISDPDLALLARIEMVQALLGRDATPRSISVSRGN